MRDMDETTRKRREISEMYLRYAKENGKMALRWITDGKTRGFNPTLIEEQSARCARLAAHEAFAALRYKK